MRFSGKTAFITGGGTGIGAAVARRMAADGAKVVLMGRRREPLEAVTRDIGGLVVQGEYDPNNEAKGRKVALDKLINEIVDGAQSQW